MGDTVVHLHKNTEPPVEPATVTTLTVVPDPAPPAPVRCGCAPGVLSAAPSPMSGP